MDIAVVGTQARVGSNNKQNITVCLFHIGQSILRKAHGFRLVESYILNEKLCVRCKMLLAWAFVPTPSVVAIFDAISELLRRNCTKFTTTLRTSGLVDATNLRRGIRTLYWTWINGFAQQTSMCKHGTVLFKRLLGYVHPTMYNLIEVILSSSPVQKMQL